MRRPRLKAIVAIELGTCRCIGARPAREEAGGYGRGFESSGVLFTPQSLAHEKAVGGDAKAPVMMESTPVASFIVVQAQLGFQFLVIPLDAPSSHDGGHQALHSSGGGERGPPGEDGVGVTSLSFDEQPLLRAGAQ